jgi:cytochrome c
MMRPALIALSVLALLTGCSDPKHEQRLRAAGPNPTLDALLKVADAGAGERRFGQCMACHTVAAGAPDMAGPNLHAIYGKPMGRNRPGYGYSAALRDAKGTWDAPTLDAWMQRPQKVVSGTAMMFSGVSDPLDRADIIAYLRTQR